MDSLLTQLADELLVQDITEPSAVLAAFPMTNFKPPTITSSNSSPWSF